MGKGLLFFCCSCCILVLTIVNLSIGPIINGTYSPIFNDEDWGTINCKEKKDTWDTHDKAGDDDDTLKYQYKYPYDACIREKGMHDMEYTAFIFDIVIGFISGLLGLLHLFDLKKDFVSNTGLIGLICGFVGFVLTLVYVIFNGLVYTTVYVDNNPVYKRDGDYAFAEKDGDNFKCLYFDHIKNPNSIYAKISDLGKKQYNYNSDIAKEYTDDKHTGCIDSTYNLHQTCAGQEKLVRGDDFANNVFTSCDLLYIDSSEINQLIVYKDLSDRFLTTLILSLFVCLASIGLALFGFLLFRTPGDF